jgi:Zn-dependent protease
MSDLLSPQMLTFGFITYFVFLFSTTCHEAAHAFVAKLGGDETAAEGGQVSLNPIPHIRRSPYGMVVFPLISFFLLGGNMIGFASAPYDPTWERQHPRRSAWMALAGPATNFILMMIAVLCIRAGIAFHFIDWVPGRGPVGLPAFVLFMVFSLNLLLGIFNLIPAPPLDGSTAIMLLMSESQAQKYLDLIRGGTFALPGLLVGLIVFKYIFPPIELFVTRLLLP